MPVFPEPDAGGFGYWTNLNNSSNYYIADAAKALAIHAAEPNLTWAGIDANGGNDEIIRDRSGGYALGPGFWDFNINGGSGTDTVSYELATNGLEADLWLGWADIADGGGKVYNTDILNSIENLTGTNFNDVIVGSAGDNVLRGLNGNDYITATAGDDSVEGGNHNDTLDGGSGEDTIKGGHGHDSIEGGSDHDLLYGDEGNDTIDGGGSNDAIMGGDGNDDLYGGWGNDSIVLGTGDDEAWGGSGNDTIYIGGTGDNTVDGGSGTDTAYFTDADGVTVVLFGGFSERSGGDDVLQNIENVTTANGHDTVYGSVADNVIRTHGGNDFVAAFAGENDIDSGSGNDIVWGGAEMDEIAGGSGNDDLWGGAGNDVIGGGSGMDTVVGGDGSDNLSGGANADVFRWYAGEEGVDTVWDFNVYQDEISFGADYFDFGPGMSDAEDVLVANYIGNNTTLLSAHTDDGWESVAMFKNVDAAVMNQKIEDGTILDVEINDVVGDGPGGLVPATRAEETTYQTPLDERFQMPIELDCGLLTC